MLHIKSFTFNGFQENSYLIVNDDKECWAVDPGMYEAGEVSQFKQYLSANNLQLKSIINTHTHIDHIFGVQALKDAYNVPFGIHEKDLPVLGGAVGSAMLFGFNFPKAPVPDFYIADGTPLMLGKDEIEVRFTPGHSPGSISFYYPEGKWVLSGDVLFNGSIGRTDLPGGSFDTLIGSIKGQLLSLPDGTTVYSGHGPATTIGNERLYNPFLLH
jgi:glyoxylase-like metal-dependent hydrolase (beta-lactamase superfamily II)